ncbi:hypothetical protein [Lentzea nigeriaca]|uniref:hypothetical protein n=1 Tax=Lentzea nigeriaca TaxID=1128665 RepID=UPI0027DE7403|nr:hypothetical protein [Lentzea nigeriaca]MBM7861820.1 hypothetical protein [Lentzea nigeriaca]
MCTRGRARGNSNSATTFVVIVFCSPVFFCFPVFRAFVFARAVVGDSSPAAATASRSGREADAV